MKTLGIFFIKCLVGITALLIFTLVWIGPLDPRQYISFDPLQSRITQNFRTNGMINASQLGIDNVVFVCISGRYSTCEEDAKSMASSLQYEIKWYTFSHGKGFGLPPFNSIPNSDRIIFFNKNEVREVSIPNGPLYIAPADDYCECFRGLDINIRNHSISNVRGK